jgi:hypothetical protein
MGKTGAAFDGNNIVFTAIKLYEAGGFDIVYGGKAGTISGVAGYQNSNGTEGSMLRTSTASFSYPISTATLTVLAQAACDCLRVSAATQPSYDIGLTKVSMPVYVANVYGCYFKGYIGEGVYGSRRS